MKLFDFEPALSIPFRDKAEIARCRAIDRKDIDKHHNADFMIRVIPDADMVFHLFADIVSRIQNTAREGRPCVMLLPNPWPRYVHVARILNATRTPCQHCWFFAMDEYADQDGHIAPDTWSRGFMYSLLKFFWSQINPELRPPREQVIGPTNQNLSHYHELMEEAGGLDISYTGPGWTGHVAFCEPDAPEFAAPLEEWKRMGARICTLSPYTIAQNSLHGSMGYSGDLSAVPPKAATVGAKEVISARHRIEMASITLARSQISWQRLIARLCYHGPVTPRLPTSIHQTLRTDCWISESVAANIEDTWEVGY